MNHELLCAWLGLPAGVWPPDHYRLLGLTLGEPHLDVIEAAVHKRLDRARCYQMTHPEVATEAMNRIAQAFVCLSDPACKRAYDAALLGTTVVPSEPTPVLGESGPVVLVYSPEKSEAIPPPIRVAFPEATPPPIRRIYSEATPVAPQAIPPDVQAEPIPVATPVEPMAAEPSPARRVCTKRQLYHRLVQTRRLLTLWKQAGDFLAAPKKRLTRLHDASRLQKMLQSLQAAAEPFSRLIGEAGQPGSQVVELAKTTEVALLRSLAPAQRETLSQDWQAGLKLLEAHRDFLRQEARQRRRRTLWQRVQKRVRIGVLEQPGRVLVLTALVALTIAFWRTYVFGWMLHSR